MQQRRVREAPEPVYFVRKHGKTVTGVAKPSDARTVAEYRADPAWVEVKRDEYLTARSIIALC